MRIPFLVWRGSPSAGSLEIGVSGERTTPAAMEPVAPIKPVIATGRALGCRKGHSSAASGTTLPISGWFWVIAGRFGSRAEPLGVVAGPVPVRPQPFRNLGRQGAWNCRFAGYLPNLRTV